MENNEELQIKKTKVMTFIYNALCNGWTVNKDNDTYVFTKNHLNREEVFQESYLQTFINTNNIFDSTS
jgi:hypothetical protein